MAEQELRSMSDPQNGSIFSSTATIQKSPRRKNRKKVLLLVGVSVVLVIGVSCLVAGLVLITKWSQSRDASDTSSADEPANKSETTPSCNVSLPTLSPDPCEFSSEAKKAGKCFFLRFFRLVFLQICMMIYSLGSISSFVFELD